MTRRPTEPVALLNLLDALDDFNRVTTASHPEPEPEGTGGVLCDALVCSVVAAQLDLPMWVVVEVARDRWPVKKLKKARDWISQHLDADEDDRRRMLRGYGQQRHERRRAS
jgi:hypothetical protein